ncbi:MAG: hypothetical protein P8012_18075 [Desulfobacterales bacterium]
MKKKILVLNANDKECKSLCTLLNQHQFLAVPIDSISAFDINLKSSGCIAAILDLDSIAFNNQIFKSFSMNHPDVRLLCLSTKRFHPELRDAICHHIYACLNKPVDPDELFFLLKSICEERDS